MRFDVGYEWSTATAGSANLSLTSSDEAPDSICPKGWRLPAGGKYYNNPDANLNNRPLDQEKSFYRLLLAYGYPEWQNYSFDKSSKNARAETFSDSARNPFVNEIALSKAGGVSYRYYDDGNSPSFSSVGALALLWSNSGQPSGGIAYYLNASGNFVYPTFANGYSYAQGVRCVAR